MSDVLKKAYRLGEIERKISDGQALLQRSDRANTSGWIFLFIGVLITIFLGGFLKVLGILVIGASIWRMVQTSKYRSEIESGLREYRGQKAELQALLSAKE